MKGKPSSNNARSLTSNLAASALFPHASRLRMLEFSLPYNLTVDLAAVADVVAAAIVTTHVLLTKRDVRGSIGWIGLAWLSPLLGSLLYFLFGINRVARRAARRRRQTEPRRPRLPPRRAAPRVGANIVSKRLRSRGSAIG